MRHVVGAAFVALALVSGAAGATRADAEKVLAQAKARGFPAANVRRMQVVLVHP